MEAVETEEAEILIKFEDPKWVGGTWDLNQFQKDGKTDWDAVIDSGEVLVSKFFSFDLLYDIGFGSFWV